MNPKGVTTVKSASEEKEKNGQDNYQINSGMQLRRSRDGSQEKPSHNHEKNLT